MLEPEPDENERELKKARAELKSLRSQEPEITFELREGDDRVAQRLDGRILHYSPLTGLQIAKLVDHAGVLCPMATDFGPKSAEEAAASSREKLAKNPLTFATLLQSGIHDILAGNYEPATGSRPGTWCRFRG